MHPADIQSELKKKGITQESIAEDLGISPVNVSKVINKQMISKRTMKAIAGAIDQDYRIVFSEYFLNPKRRDSKKAA